MVARVIQRMSQLSGFMHDAMSNSIDWEDIISLLSILANPVQGAPCWLVEYQNR